MTYNVSTGTLNPTVPWLAVGRETRFAMFGTLVSQCFQSALHTFNCFWQMKEEKSASDVNLDMVKSTTPGLPGRAYSFILIGRNVDQWRYCLGLPQHDTSAQSTFRRQC